MGFYGLGSLKVTCRPKHVGPEHKLNSKCIIIRACVNIFLYFKVIRRYSKLGNVLCESNDFLSLRRAGLSSG